MIRSGEKKVQALQIQLELARSARTPAQASKTPSEPAKKSRGRTSDSRRKTIPAPQLTSEAPVEQPLMVAESSEEAAEKLRAAIASATAALAALEGRQSLFIESELPSVTRARSEGPKEAPEGILSSAARRHSRARSLEGMKRRVSFGKLPNEDDDDSDDDKPDDTSARRLSAGGEPEPEQELTAPEPLREEDVVPATMPWRPGIRLSKLPETTKSCAVDEAARLNHLKSSEPAKSCAVDEKSTPARGRQQAQAPITPRRSRPKEQELASPHQSMRSREEIKGQEMRPEDADAARPRRVWRKGKVES